VESLLFYPKDELNTVLCRLAATFSDQTIFGGKRRWRYYEGGLVWTNELSSKWI